MKKLFIFVLSLSVALSTGCGKADKADPKQNTAQLHSNQPQNKKTPKQSDQQSTARKKPEGEPQSGDITSKSGQDIDIDKLDIPDNLKEAIKSGRIPKDRIRQILEMARERGNAPLVDATPVQKANLNSYLVLNGVVEPERKVEIFSRLAAYVKKIIKEEGDYVKENEVLALLDDTEIKISYDQARIQLEQAKLSLEEAENNYIRSQELIKKDLISEQEFQSTEAIFKQRQLEYQNRMESFKNLSLQLNWTKIRSLSEGYITERLIEVGDRVNTNQQVYCVEDFSPLLVRVFVPTSDATKLRPGMKVEVKTEVIGDTIFVGNVKLINPRIDVQTGTVKVTVEVFDKTLGLKPGMFVETRIVTGVKKDVLVIPRRAVLFKQNKTYVFVLNRNQASQREVTLGITEEDQVEVLSGLTEGDVIVEVGVESLKDGERVEVVR